MTCRVVALHSFPATVRRDQGLCRHGTGLVDWPPMTRSRTRCLSRQPKFSGARKRVRLAISSLWGRYTGRVTAALPCYSALSKVRVATYSLPSQLRALVGSRAPLPHRTTAFSQTVRLSDMNCRIRAASGACRCPVNCKGSGGKAHGGQLI